MENRGTAGQDFVKIFKESYVTSEFLKTNIEDLTRRAIVHAQIDVHLQCLYLPTPSEISHRCCAAQLLGS